MKLSNWKGNKYITKRKKRKMSEVQSLLHGMGLSPLFIILYIALVYKTQMGRDGSWIPFLCSFATLFLFLVEHGIVGPKILWVGVTILRACNSVPRFSSNMLFRYSLQIDVPGKSRAARKESPLFKEADRKEYISCKVIPQTVKKN